MSRGYISDAKNVRDSGMYVTEHEAVCWMLVSFVMGACGAVTVLILLGVQ